MTDRLTKEQADAVDEDARIVCETGLHCRESERLARLRILDLKAQNAALLERNDALRIECRTHRAMRAYRKEQTDTIRGIENAIRGALERHDIMDRTDASGAMNETPEPQTPSEKGQA